MRPGHRGVVADADDGAADEPGADDVQLARDREVRAVEPQLAVPRVVRVREQDAAAAGGDLAAQAVRVAAHDVGGHRHVVGRDPGGDGRRRGVRDAADLHRHVAEEDRAPVVELAELLHPGGAAAARVVDVRGADRADLLAGAGGEAAHERPGVGRRRARRVGVAVEQPLELAAGDEAPVEDVAVEVAALGPEVARALAADGEHPVGQGADVVLRERPADAEADAGVVLRLHVRHAVRRAAHLGRVAARSPAGRDGRGAAGADRGGGQRGDGGRDGGAAPPRSGA